MNASDNVWALVAVKGFGRAKARLVPSLGRADSSRLARAMLGDVLDALSRTDGLAGVLVVTGDAEVANVAVEHGIVVLPEPVEAGTNAAVRRGIEHLRRIGASACLVVHSDVPFVTPTELGMVIDQLAQAPIVIVPADRDGGTNIMALAPPGVITTAFGTDSFDRHRAIAAAAGVEIAILRLAGAGHDIDTLADLSDVPPQGIRTRALLRQLPIARDVCRNLLAC